MTTWIKCADQVPPDDETEVILRNSNGKVIGLPGYIWHLDADLTEEWTPYTPELWEELNGQD